MSSDHHLRVIGMGLLLGKLSFKDLQSVRQALGSPDEAADFGSLFQELLRQGTLDPEVLERLEAQVKDLERLLEGNEGPGRDHVTRELGPVSAGGACTADYLPEDRSGASRTPPQGMLASVSDEGIGDEEARALLSVITLPRWNHYLNLQFVGEGGMGRIFKAYDPTLNRVVALKFLRWTGGDAISSLIEEARNQAQVDHPNICKVYEVRAWKGQVYVAMQYIAGRTLDKLAPELDIDAKVELMATVAEAAHAAHRHGLVHRDLKPANIMVETTPEGGLNPYILDFGLAWNLSKSEESGSGRSIEGTFHYMAPEQAAGDVERIERRTDVYALGVILYELFTGHPPFHDLRGGDCLRHICEADIPRVGDLNPKLHPDLETIVSKCLEKPIAQRYESARALAEDLRRYRDQEPILARPVTLMYRLGKLARKHRLLFGLATAASLALLFLLGWGLQARVTASRQARWAQHFGQEAERIEALLRYARLLPLHDIRKELDVVHGRIAAMEAEMVRLGSGAQGPGNYALGRAFLALGETNRAAAHLDQAWTAGFRMPDAAYARGRALGQAYVPALQKARMIKEPQLREARLEELEERYRKPALDLLRRGKGSLLEPASFQEGLLAFYDRRYAEALALAREASRSAPWFYEAWALEAQVHLEQAQVGGDPAQTLGHLKQAEQALSVAAKVAPSDPDLFDLQTRRWWEEMILSRRTGRDARVAFEAFRELCEGWRRVLPGAPGPEARLAWGKLEWARVAKPLQRGLLLQDAIEEARRVVDRVPDHEEALGALAAGLSLQAYAALDAGQDPRDALDRASALLKRALEGGSSAFELFEPFAATLWARVEYEKYRGIDPAATVEGALVAIQNLATRYPRVPDFSGFMGGILGEWADYQANHGIDPSLVLRRAIVHLDRASRMAPTRFEYPFTRGTIHLALASYHVMQGQPATEALDAAEAGFRGALAHNATSSGAYFGLGEVGLLRCQELERQHRSPLEALDSAEALMSAEPVQREDSWRTGLFQAQALLIRARWTGDPEVVRRLLERAEGQAEQALHASGRLAFAWYVKALVQVAWVRHFPAEASRRRNQARLALKETLRQDPGFEPGLRLRASLN